MPRSIRRVVVAALLLLVPSISSAQIGGSGSIQGTVLDTSKAALPGATVTATNVATGIETVRQTTAAGVYALTPLQPGTYRVTVSLDGFQHVRPRTASSSTGCAWSASMSRCRSAGYAGGRRHRRAAAAGDRRCAARTDDPQRRLHRAPAGDEHRRPARSDRLHVPHAGRAVDRPLGQRDGRPGLHDRHVRGRHSDHQCRRPGRRTQPVVTASRSRRSTSSRSKRAARP